MNMKKFYLALTLILFTIGLHPQPTRTIFITGGNFGPTFVNYVAALTKKTNPKICFIPTASAGSLCWFLSGITDARPVKLSFVDCLGFISTSHCPHYHSEPGRKPLYQQAILSGKLPAGYACDDKAGILFENEKLIKSVAADTASHPYFVSVAAGKIKEEELPVEVIR